MGGKSCGARTKRRWRGLTTAVWVLIAVACSTVMHWTLRRESTDSTEEPPPPKGRIAVGTVPTRPVTGSRAAAHGAMPPPTR
jgi:hypothetical protein